MIKSMILTRKLNKPGQWYYEDTQNPDSLVAFTCKHAKQQPGIAGKIENGKNKHIVVLASLRWFKGARKLPAYLGVFPARPAFNHAASAQFISTKAYSDVDEVLCVLMQQLHGPMNQQTTLYVRVSPYK